MSSPELNLNHWRNHESFYQLKGSICLACEEVYFPPRKICPAPDCNNDHVESFQFSGKGEIFGFTDSGIDNAVAIIKLEEGPMVAAQLTDFEKKTAKQYVDGELKDVRKIKAVIGQKVEMVTRILKEDDESGQIIYGYKFRPTISSKEVSMSSR